MSDAALSDVAAALTQALGCEVATRPVRSVHGGCISESYRWECKRGPMFVKVGSGADAEAFAAEAEGLAELVQARAVRVPQVLARGRTDSNAFLALEWIDLHPADAAKVQERLGEQLAFQHRVSASSFGWHRDNTIGSTPQRNATHADWVSFFREQRLAFQLRLARERTRDARLEDRGARLLELMGAFFGSYRPIPSLLHGDLWSGNCAADDSRAPVIFDPAVYYGDREADIAMTRLFGGFSNAFYTAYHASWPLDQAAGTRRALYNLYHVLNHFNLFGGGYLAQAMAMIDRLLAELGH
jgi:protein-ribulosamine 3-kinase